MSRFGKMVGALRGRLGSLPLPALLAVGAIVLAGTAVGGLYAYRTYDYVQHDNEFCLSCHLMQEPFERFARSEHRGLGCKACHRPNLIERGTMGLTQIVEDPDSLGIHAEVPNEVCADCHIEGDPEQWALVANSAGHRIHLESPDSALAGLRCVECHSTSVHEFASVDRTCAQSSCHVESAIQLGEMSDLSIHCVACHAFSAPIPGEVGTEVFADALSPSEETCLTCHEMRLLVELPDPDPHEGSCAACHNPHVQATPSEAIATCSSAACHQDVATLTPHHEGVPETTLNDCTYCHEAHDFHVDGSNCLSCHVGILEDDPSVPRRGDDAVRPDTARAISRSERGDGPVVRFASSLVFRERAARAMHAEPARSAPEAQAATPFLHSEHPALECAACHSSEERHGEVTVASVEDCRSCHHTEPVSTDCAACHVDSGSTGDPYSVPQSMVLAVSGEFRRSLPFDHGPHAEESCATCHDDGLDLAPSGLDCASCHEDHHAPATNCMSCHEPAATDAHPVEEVHRTCSGVGCHTDGPFEVVPRTREVCLGCHQDLVDHRPDEPDCAECHALASPGAGPA